MALNPVPFFIVVFERHQLVVIGEHDAVNAALFGGTTDIRTLLHNRIVHCREHVSTIRPRHTPPRLDPNFRDVWVSYNSCFLLTCGVI